MECNEAIYNPLCHVCLADEIRQWIGEHKNKKVRNRLDAEINKLLKSFQNINKLEAVKCAVCGINSTILCPYCFTEILYEKLKALTKSKRLHAGFLGMFNFDFEHTGYTKEMERLGMI